MITKEQFHSFYTTLNFGEVNAEDFLYGSFVQIMNHLFARSQGNIKVVNSENLILDYVVQEYLYLLIGKDKEAVEKIITDPVFFNQFINIVSDKVFFNEITPYHAVSLLSHQSPVISNMELNINFILNRINAIKKTYPQKDILLDMLAKAFLMFKSINYLLSTGFETEAFSTWRTIHELECVIKVIADNPYLTPIYLRHIVYNNAFRNEFEDKDEQQRTIDDLKVHMKEHDLKSKDMKKYIEYGYLYSIENLQEKVPTFKLNFRNGLEACAGLERYSSDYEMSSEVAHSSPLLIYSNKSFFKSITIVRSYETFLRLEEIFYQLLKQYENVDSQSYDNMRKMYTDFSRRILKIETMQLAELVKKSANKKR